MKIVGIFPKFMCATTILKYKAVDKSDFLRLCHSTTLVSHFYVLVSLSKMFVWRHTNLNPQMWHVAPLRKVHKKANNNVKMRKRRNNNRETKFFQVQNSFGKEWHVSDVWPQQQPLCNATRLLKLCCVFLSRQSCISLNAHISVSNFYAIFPLDRFSRINFVLWFVHELDIVQHKNWNFQCNEFWYSIVVF